MAGERRRVILVVDDDDAVRTTLVDQLSSRYTVAEARDGSEAIQWLGQQRPEAAAVVLDVQMPQVGGLRVLEYLAWAQLRIPVLLHTANASLALGLRQQGLPVAGILLKPASQGEVMRQIEAALADGAGQAPPATTDRPAGGTGGLRALLAGWAGRRRDA
jgi:CheY-like chemotaxis protein